MKIIVTPPPPQEVEVVMCINTVELERLIEDLSAVNTSCVTQLRAGLLAAVRSL